jgi:hypothetical protein
MHQLVVKSMQWSSLSHIADLRPVDDSDGECLQEIRQVLQKHNRLSRFGVSFLHSHFDLEDDEILLETTDEEKREHYVRPVKKSYLADNGITVQSTVIGFDENGYHQYCGCNPVSTGHHHKQT